MSGFFSWLAGLFKEREEQTKIDDYRDIQKVRIKTPEPGPQPTRKPKYQPFPRTKETSDYVESVRKKAYSQDSKPKSYRDTSDPKQIESITKKIKEKL